jgi:hypothetical protein
MTTRNPIPSGVGITEKRARPGNRNLAELLELLLTKACLAIFRSFSQQIHLVTKELEKDAEYRWKSFDVLVP